MRVNQIEVHAVSEGFRRGIRHKANTKIDAMESNFNLFNITYRSHTAAQNNCAKDEQRDPVREARASDRVARGSILVLHACICLPAP